MPHEINHLHLLLFSHISYCSYNFYGSLTSKWQWKTSCIFFTTFSFILFSSVASPSWATLVCTENLNCNPSKTQNHNSATVAHHNLWSNHHFPPPKPNYYCLLSMWMSACVCETEREREREREIGALKRKFLRSIPRVLRNCTPSSYEFNKWTHYECEKMEHHFLCFEST